MDMWDSCGEIRATILVGNVIWKRRIDQLLATSELSFEPTNDSFEVRPNCSGPGVSDDTPFQVNSVKQILNPVTLNEIIILLLIMTPVDFKEEGV